MSVFVVYNLCYRFTSGIFIHNGFELDTFEPEDEKNTTVILRTSKSQKHVKRQHPVIVKEKQYSLTKHVNHSATKF